MNNNILSIPLPSPVVAAICGTNSHGYCYSTFEYKFQRRTLLVGLANLVRKRDSYAEKNGMLIHVHTHA